jgi:hypothetical protein
VLNGSSLDVTPIFGRNILLSFHHTEYVIFHFDKSTLLWILLNLCEDELLFQNTLDLQGDYFCIHEAVHVAFSNEFVRIFILKFPHNHRRTTAREHTCDVAFLRGLRCRADVAFLCNEESSPLRSLLKGLADLV